MKHVLSDQSLVFVDELGCRKVGHNGRGDSGRIIKN
jgi:hypothetical protein